MITPRRWDNLKLLFCDHRAVLKIVGIAGVLCAIVLYLDPRFKVPSDAPPASDLVAHGVGFAVMASVLVLGWWRWLVAVLVVLIALAVGLEAAQLGVPAREFAWKDMAANLAGLLVGLLIARHLVRTGILRTLARSPMERDG